jgi:hypothetical protein
MGEADENQVTIAEAARLSALFAASMAIVAFAATLAIAVGDYGGLEFRGPLLLNMFLSWPVWAVLVSGSALFGLTVRRHLFTAWDFAWRGVLSAYLGIAIATCGALLVGILGPNPGYGGGFIWVLVTLIGFTVFSGPLLAGLMAALLRPRRLRGNRGDRDRTDSRRRLGYVLLISGAAVCLGLIASSALASSRGGMEYNCMVAGPVPTEPPLAVVSEAPGIVEGSFSVWPLGRQCEWNRADGRGTVVADSGAWGSTALAAGAGLLSLIGAGLVLASSPYRAMRD